VATAPVTLPSFRGGDDRLARRDLGSLDRHEHVLGLLVSNALRAVQVVLDRERPMRSPPLAAKVQIGEQDPSHRSRASPA